MQVKWERACARRQAYGMRRWRPLGILLLAAAALSSTALQAQHRLRHIELYESTTYLGTVTNDGLPRSPGRFTVRIDRKADSTFSGTVEIGDPLGGSGPFWGKLPVDDSVAVLVSVSSVGDTIVWRALRTGQQLTGRYSIRGGRWVGQGGHFITSLVAGPPLELSSTPRHATPAGPAPGLSNGPSGLALELAPPDTTNRLGATEYSTERSAANALGTPGRGQDDDADLAWGCLVALMAGLVAGAWWALRAPATGALQPTSPSERELVGVGGWMGLFLFGQGAAVLLMLLKIHEVWEPFTSGAWSVGALYPIFRPVTLIESGWHLVQIAVPVLGLVLTVKEHRTAPRLWFAYLVLVMAYAVIDLTLGSQIESLLAHMPGLRDAELTQSRAEMQSAAQSNLRGLFLGLVWSAYWARSRRVRFTFGATALSRKSSPVDTLPDTTGGTPAAEDAHEARHAAIAPRGDAEEHHTGADPDAASETTSRIDASNESRLQGQLRPPEPPRDASGSRARRVERPCPYCAEPILAQARYCKHCHRDVEPTASFTPSN